MQPTSPPDNTRRVRILVLSFFFLSGACGLVYEVVWTRMLGLIMGSTTFSITTVLTSFMGGLALGSYLAGRWIDRSRNPLGVYGALEGAIGAYCISVPFLIRAAEPLFAWLYQNGASSPYLFALSRFAICGVLLLVPTTLMGATLPVLIKFFVDRAETLGLTVGAVYGVNTFGAVVGCASTGFFLIPWLGMRRTTWTAACVNVAIAVAVWMIPRTERLSAAAGSRPAPDESSVPPWDTAWLGTALLVGFALSGFAAMVYQVAWTRVLTLMIGSSTYAFTIIVASFILGIGIGSVVLSRWIDRGKHLILGFGLVELGIGFSALLFVPVLGRLPVDVGMLIVRFYESFGQLQLVEFLVTAMLLLVPTTLMGVAFPLVTKLYVRDLRELGTSVGRAYAANTLGAILGSFTAGFVLIPLVGVQRAIYVAVGVNVLVGATFVMACRASTPAMRRLLAGLLVWALGVLLWRIPTWDQMLMTSGPYLYAVEMKLDRAKTQAEAEEQLRTDADELYYKEGVTATVSVLRAPDGVTWLRVNGKNDASSLGDMPSQQLVGHLPLLLTPGAKDVLVIGLGSGVTLGMVQQYPVRHIDCVEICAAVVAAARHFDKFSRRDPSDPRVHIIVGDGRTHAVLTDKKYDVISSQPSNPWIAGIANLFTVDFFESCRKRLKPGGIMAAWFHSYSMSAHDFRMIVRTFQHVFPKMSLWQTAYADYLLLGSDRPIAIPYAHVKGVLGDPKLRALLRNVMIEEPLDLLSFVAIAPKDIAEYTRGTAVNTDDNAALEFSAPRSIYLPMPRLGIVPLFWRTLARARDESRIPLIVGLPDALHKRLFGRAMRVLKSRLNALKGCALIDSPPNEAQGIAYLHKALELNSRNLIAYRKLTRRLLEKGDALLHAGTETDDKAKRREFFEQARNQYAAAAKAAPQFFRSHGKLGLALYNLGAYDSRLYDRAIEEFKRAVELNPEDAPAMFGRGAALLQKRKTKEAIKILTRAVALRPTYMLARRTLAFAYEMDGDWPHAETAWGDLLEINPRDTEARERLLAARRKATERGPRE